MAALVEVLEEAQDVLVGDQALLDTLDGKIEEAGKALLSYLIS